MISKRHITTLASILCLLIFLSAACSALPSGNSSSFREWQLAELATALPNLSLEEHAYDIAVSDIDGRFALKSGKSYGEIMAKREAEREKPAQIPGTTLINGEELSLEFGQSGNQGTVTVMQAGKAIYTGSYGEISPVQPVGGLWVVGGNWVLELVQTSSKTEGNTTELLSLGDIIINGKSMNATQGYEESFGFQTLSGKPFYFYQKNGLVGFFYDGEHVQTGYTRVSHYLCCSAAALNPRPFQNMVAFYAERGHEFYYVELGNFTASPAAEDPSAKDQRLLAEAFPQFKLEETELSADPFAATNEALSFETFLSQESFAKYADARSEKPEYPSPLQLNGKELSVVQLQAEGINEASIMLGDKTLYEISFGEPIEGYDPVRGVWVYDGNWVFEAAYVYETGLDGGPKLATSTDIVINGQSQRMEHGAYQCFGFQLLAGKPFFLCSTWNKSLMVYDGKAMELSYEAILHDQAGQRSALNPIASENMVSFFASRWGKAYFVELGLFD